MNDAHAAKRHRSDSDRSRPQYLNQDFVTSSHFKKEADGSKWAPSTCKP